MGLNGQFKSFFTLRLFFERAIEDRGFPGLQKGARPCHQCLIGLPREIGGVDPLVEFLQPAFLGLKMGQFFSDLIRAQPFPAEGIGERLGDGGFPRSNQAAG